MKGIVGSFAPYFFIDMSRILLFIGIFMGISQVGYSQYIHGRIEAEISVKELHPDRKPSLMMGKVFYDAEEGLLIYDIKFPEKELMLIDSSKVMSKKDTLVEREVPASIIQFSIYKLLLSGDMKSYGLPRDEFNIVNINETDAGIQADWVPKNKEINYLIRISQQNGKINGIANYLKDGTLLGKQLFSDYVKVGRIEFPTKIYEISPLPNGGEHKKLTTHSNIIIDDESDEDDYYSGDVLFGP